MSRELRSWLNLNLLRDERLKRLVALGLMVLNRSATEGGCLTAYATGSELAATTVNYFSISVWSNSSSCECERRDYVHLLFEGSATRQEFGSRRLGRVEDKWFLKKQIERLQLLNVAGERPERPARLSP